MATSLVTHLDSIASGYKIFEANQVLTHEDLNTIPEYLDDQQRLTRVALHGVGIAWGLELKFDGESVTLAPGVAVTTDGDLIRVAAEQVYTDQREYAGVAPKGSPFAERGVRELLVAATREAPLPPDAQPIRGALRGELLAVLYVESCQKDKDECTGTDCDNQGRELKHTLRMLVMEAMPRAVASGRTSGEFATARDVAKDLPVPFVPRVSVSSALSSPGALVSAYATAVQTANTSVKAAIGRLVFKAGGWLPEALASSLQSLVAALDAAETAGSRPHGFQYAYDFFIDVAQTIAAVRSALLDDTSMAPARPLEFSKHVELGRLDGARGFRTPWLPSRVPRSLALDRAGFLARKLIAMIQAFEIPGPVADLATGLRITPGKSLARGLEERPIPIYFNVDQLERAWSPTDELPLGYRLEANARDSGIAADAEFFRIEGHVGSTVGAVESALRQKIRERNLSVAVRSVLVGTDALLARQPGADWSSDLHRTHAAARHQIALAILRAKEFGAHLSGAVSAVSTPDTQREKILKTLTFETAAFSEVASQAIEVLELDLSQRPLRWKESIAAAVDAANVVKNALPSGEAATDSGTPYDEIAASAEGFLSALDQLIDGREASLRARALLHRLPEHSPGAEHRGGVPAGGTFLLAHDGTGIVVADFMLPYWTVELDRASEDVKLKVPKEKPQLDPFIRKYQASPRLKGVRLLQSPEIMVRKVEVAERAASVGLIHTVMSSGVGKVVSGSGSTAPQPAPSRPPDLRNADARKLRTEVEELTLAERKLAEVNAAGGDATAATNGVLTAEKKIAEMILGSMQQLAQSAQPDLSSASEETELVAELSSAYERIKGSRTAPRSLRTKMADIAGTAANPDMQGRLNAIARQ